MRNENDVNASGSVSAGELPVLGYREIVARSGTAALVDNLRIRLGLPPDVYGRAVQPVIEAYAEFVQLLPDAESPKHSESGGLFREAIERTSLALDYRRGQILPPNAAPEAIGEQSHRWTYAVFVAALLHDIATVTARLRVTICDRRGTVTLWFPHAGSLPALGATRYRVEFVDSSAPQAEIFSKLPVLLFKRFVPLFIQEWLVTDATLTRELSSLLSGEPSVRQGAIGPLVLRADGVTGRRALEPMHAADNTEVVAAPQYLNDEPHGQDPIDAKRAVAKHLSEEDVMARAPDAARRFMHWVQRGILDRSIPINEANAWVHFVAEGMLLVSPRVFKEFLKGLVADGISSPLSSAGDEKDAVKAIQRELLRAGWHVRAEQGINMLTYQVMRGGCAVSRISGVVIRAPERFVNPLPSPNRELVLMSRRDNTE